MDYDKLIAPAAKAMRPSGIRKFFDLAADMPECISLGVGEPDFKTPWAVREAGIESLEHGRTRYTANAGLKELRAEICRYLERRMNLHYDPLTQVLVTVGGSEAIDMCIRTLVKPGDEVIIPEPCFVCYEPITTLSGGVPVHVPCRQEDEFRLRPEALKAAITPKTKLLIMPFPNNPTGAVMEKEDLEAIAEVLRDTNVLVLSDEIYAELNYGLRPHVSIATLPGMAERTVEGRNYYTLLERRRVDASGNLTIESKLYRSETEQVLGYETSLNALEKYSNLVPELFLPGVGSIGLVPVRTPQENTVDGSPDPVSIYAPAAGLIHNINRNEAQMNREFENGRSRIVASADLLKTASSLRLRRSHK